MAFQSLHKSFFWLVFAVLFGAGAAMAQDSSAGTPPSTSAAKNTAAPAQSSATPAAAAASASPAPPPVPAAASDDATKAPAASKNEAGAAKAADTDVDLRERPRSAKTKKEQAEKLKHELEPTYKKWLNEDVVWIITDEERKTFSKLSNDEERDNFIEQFWARRNPDPDSEDNAYKDEHYRRIAYANDHFASGIPGWRTDRGRTYIRFGPPDSIDAHPSGGTYQRPEEEGGGETSTYPFEDWRYRYIEGVGQEVIIEFVDTCMCNDYHMTLDRSEKDALLEVPGAGLTDYEAMGMASKTDRFSTPGLERLGTGPFTSMNDAQQFDRIEQFAKINQAPPVKFKDLEEVVTHKITVNLLPFEVRADFVRITGDTVLVPITIQVQNKDVTFVNKDGVQRGTLNIFGRLTTLTGRIAQTFEDTVQIDTPAELLEKTAAQASVYWKAVPLRPGRYRLDVVLKDVNGDRKGVWSKGLVVPEYSEDKLATSTLILADQMEKVPNRQVGSGNFVIGDLKVRPRLAPADGRPASFKRNERVNFWMQVYNLSLNQQTHKADATVEYDIVNLATNKPIVHSVEKTAQMGNIGNQLTLEKSLPLTTLTPGNYQVTIKVTDEISKQIITPTPTARFVVE
jgi:GWxTD domain-containing protein